MTLKQVVIASFQPARLPPGMEPGMIEHATYASKRDTFPNGCHVCEVEIDPDTGAVQLLKYLVVDDVGTVINPLTLAGQIHGGVAQGVGQVLMEQVVYEPELWPAADSQFHGLLHAARRRPVQHRHHQQSRPHRRQSARREGRG